MLSAVAAGCSAVATAASAAVTDADVIAADVICAAVGAVVGTKPRTRCGTSEVSGLRLATALTAAPPPLAGATTDDSCADVPSTSLKAAVSTNGAGPLVTME